MTHSARYIAPRLILATLLTLTSCSRPDSNVNASNEDVTDTVMLRRAALSDITDQVILSQYADFVEKSGALTQATMSWKEDPTSMEKRDLAQQAWRDAMTSWQYAEVMQLGPAGVMGEVAGGEDLRDLIYSWPLSNSCRVDQELAKNVFGEPSFFSTQLVNVRGLDALEYALFYTEEDNSCAPNASLNSGSDWSALSIEEIDARRAGFAYAAAQDVDAQANTLHNAWATAGQDFRAELVNAGSTSNTYTSTQEALNALSDAMFYLEKETKDMKLAIPAGISQCNEMTCPDALEHRYADFALEASLANHKAFQRLYLGNAPGEPDAKGFDDLLIELGQSTLDTQIKQLLNAAIAAHEAINMPLSQALTDDLPSVIALYEASQAVGTILKTQFVSILDLEIPQRAEGDND